MFTTRRQFIARSAAGGATLAAAPLFAAGSAGAVAPARRIAAPVSRSLRFSASGEPLDASAWIVADLGAMKRIQAVRLLALPRQMDSSAGSGSAADKGRGAAGGPVDIVCADHPSFAANHVVHAWQGDAGGQLAHFARPAVRARYLRIGLPAAMPATCGVEVLADGRLMRVAFEDVADIRCPFPEHRA